MKPATPMRFHIATISNDSVQYAAMRASMAAAGFTDATCRFSLLDNSVGNAHDPYRTLRDLPADGDEPYYVLCHHDLRFGAETTYDRLSAAVADLDRRHRRWSIAGTAGISPRGERLLHLDDPTASHRVAGLPRRVQTLDENFLLVRRSAAVTPSPGLSGFHFYGGDLCLNAAVARRTCYVIDFPVTHLSGGTDTPAFYAALEALIETWRPRLWVGIVGTTCSNFCVSASPLVRRVLDREWVRDWLRARGWGVIPRRR